MRRGGKTLITSAREGDQGNRKVFEPCVESGVLDAKKLQRSLTDSAAAWRIPVLIAFVVRESFESVAFDT